MSAPQWGLLYQQLEVQALVSSNLLHAMHVPWTRLALTDGEVALIGRGLDQAEGWEGPIGEVPLGAQFLPAAQLLLWEQTHWTQPVLSTGEANQPCLVWAQKWGLGHCTVLKMRHKGLTASSHGVTLVIFGEGRTTLYANREESPKAQFSWNQNWAFLLLQNLDPWLWPWDTVIIHKEGKLVVCSPETTPRKPQKPSLRAQLYLRGLLLQLVVLRVSVNRKEANEPVNWALKNTTKGKQILLE